MNFKTLIILLFFCIIFVSCRYKENDKLVIATVKQRVEKTWHLKELVLNGVKIELGAPSNVQGVDPSASNVSTLKIIMPSSKLLNIDCNNSGTYIHYKFDNKTVIKTNDATARELKITKLTKDELWLDGDRVIPIGGNELSDKIVAKYSSKP